jgi:hypothetical protein
MFTHFLYVLVHGQAGHHLAWPLRKYRSSIAISDIRFYLRVRRKGSFSRVYFAVRSPALSSKTFQHCFFSTAVGGNKFGLVKQS